MAPHFRPVAIFNVLVLITLSLASVSLAATAEQWKSRSIYQVMVDRFARTDLSTTAACTLWEFCNGTWKGLINKLDYIQDMGFTAIQISPVVENMEADTSVGTAYHGYWSVNDYAVNPHFGTEDDLKRLSDELHKRGMYLMVDVVVNNMAAAFNNTSPPPVDYTKFYPFNDAKYFHKYCNVTEWENPVNYQDCWLYPYGVALADLATEKPVVQQMMNTWIKELVSNYSIDGIRIDAAKHVNDEFLPSFVGASGVFAFGEVVTGITNDQCRYQNLGLLPGMPNYLEWFSLTAAFNGNGMDTLETARVNSNTGCNDSLALGTFLENHDTERFAAAVPDMTLAKNGMTYVILNDGIPTVYQGQEQHLNGNSTPFNREPIWKTGYDTTAPLYKLTATLNKLRNTAIAMSSEYATTISDTLFVDVNHLCLRKGPQGSQIVFCINNRSSKGPTYELNIGGGFAPGDSVVEVLSCTTVTASDQGDIAIFMDKGEPKVFFLAEALKSTGLCQTTAPEPVAPGGDSGGGGGGGTDDKDDAATNLGNGSGSSTLLVGLLLAWLAWFAGFA